MRLFRNRALQCAGMLVLLGVAACSNPSGTNLPPVPPTPVGFTACVGHINHYVIPMYDQSQPVWYAFWQEAQDSSSATLIAAANPNSIDTILLGRDSIGWGQILNDSLYQFGYGTTVLTSQDSVIVVLFGIDTGTGYYLKKLN